MLGGMLISKCCGCAGDAANPTQCIFEDNFEEEDIRWDDYGDDGTEDGAGFALDDVAGTMTATGDGSLTLLIDPPTGNKVISVEALLIDDTTQTESGVTIRRADSDSNISLVRVWAVTDGYELRQGSTVLEAFTAAGTTQVKLIIKTPLAGTTDVECWVGGVLAHTEAGVTFSVPDELNVGLIALDGGEWDWVKVSPCPAGSSCAPYNVCSDAAAPMFWSLNADGVGGDAGSPATGCESSNECLGLQGDWILASAPMAGFLVNDEFGDILPQQWATGSDLLCSYRPVAYPEKYLQLIGKYKEQFPPFEETPELPSGVLPQIYHVPCGISALESGKWIATDRTNQAIFGNRGEYFPWTAAIVEDGGQFKVTCGAVLAWTTDFSGNNWEEPPDVFASYESALFDSTHDFTVDPIVLNLISSGGCTFPATITLTPNGDLRVFRYAAGCPEETCVPPLDPNASAMMTGIVTPGTSTATDNGFCGFLEASFNEDTLSWEWLGVMTFDADQEPCGPTQSLVNTFNVQIKCMERVEGEGRRWWLIVSGPNGPDEYLPIENITEGQFSGEASGTINNICGETAFVGLLGECDDSDHPLAACYTGDGSLCCLTSLRAEGEIVEGTIPCSFTWQCQDSDEPISLGYAKGEVLCSGSPILGIGPEDEYYLGEWPYNVPFDAVSLLVWCDGGTMKAYALDSNNCPLSPSPISSVVWDSATLTGEINLTSSIPRCCGPGGNEAAVTKISLG